MCVLWDKDAGALWVDITQDTQGGIMGVMGGERRLSVELANTPVIPCWHAHPRSYSVPPASVVQHGNIHSDKQANIRSGSALHTTEHSTR